MRIKKRVIIAVVALALGAAAVWLYLTIFIHCCAPPPVMPR